MQVQTSHQQNDSTVTNNGIQSSYNKLFATWNLLKKKYDVNLEKTENDSSKSGITWKTYLLLLL